MNPIRVAFFASGNGSNVQALIRKALELGPDNVQVCFVLSDHALAPVIEKARALGVTAFVRERISTREAHEEQILYLLKEYKVEWVFLAGYMRLLSANFLNQFLSWHSGEPRVVNIHPSLLPAYPGVDSIGRAFNDGVTESGVTLHWVDQGMDTGEMITQKSVLRSVDDDFESWSQKFHVLEYQIYTNFFEDLVKSQRRK
jgi:phosphoribosylglycinamide formyltransferase-1